MGATKQKIRRIMNSILEPRGFQLMRFHPEMQTRSMLSNEMLATQGELFLGELTSALAPFGIRPRDSLSVDEILAFSKHLKSCPVKQQAGGGGHNMGMLLWSMIKCFEPAEIIESGVFRGFTTWVLRGAAPSTPILSFDVSFAELQWRDGQTQYHQADWATVVPENLTGDVRKLAFFDDHQSQWRRIREAASRGVEFVVFDDSYPAWSLHADADAAFPTIEMLFGSSLTNGQEVAWQTECGHFRYRFNDQEAQATRALIGEWVRLPNLQKIFGYRPANLIAAQIRI
jgi:hypothetical protein